MYYNSEIYLKNILASKKGKKIPLQELYILVRDQPLLLQHRENSLAIPTTEFRCFAMKWLSENFFRGKRLELDSHRSTVISARGQELFPAEWLHSHLPEKNPRQKIQPFVRLVSNKKRDITTCWKNIKFYLHSKSGKPQEVFSSPKEPLFFPFFPSFPPLNI